MFSLLDIVLYTAVQMCWIAITFWAIRYFCNRCMEQKIKKQWYKQPLYKVNRYLGGISLLLLAGICCYYVFSSIFVFLKTKLDFEFIISTLPKYPFDFVLLLISVCLILVSLVVIVKSAKRLYYLHKEFTICCEKQINIESE